MILAYLIPDRGYTKLPGTQKLLTFTNETLQDVLARWENEVEDYRRRLERERAGMRYDPVSKANSTGPLTRRRVHCKHVLLLCDCHNGRPLREN